MTTLLAVIEEAVALCASRSRRYPDSPIFDSIARQLNYLRAVVSGTELDRSRLPDISVGVYAVREFADDDPEFATALNKAHYIADRLARGLRPDPEDLA